jgi:hypothetical protein
MTEQAIHDIDDDKKLSLAEKIAKLRDKAEAVMGTPEAEAFLMKAQELMTRYFITEELVAKAAGRNVQEEIITDTFTYTGIFRKALMDIAWSIVRANGCKAVMTEVTWSKPHRIELHVSGFKSDIERVRLLDASLQLQAAQSMQTWYRELDTDWMSGMQKYKARREFIMGFASGLSTKLNAANKAAAQSAAKDEAVRTNTTEAEASTGVALVLRSREERVKDYYDKKYGKSLRSVTRRYSSGGAEARGAGYQAGRQANTGTTAVGTRKQLGR